jgi:HEAT repeat protein
LKNGNDESRLAAVAALGGVAPKKLPRLFELIAADPVVNVRVAGAKCLVLFPQAFSQFITDQDPLVQIETIMRSRAVRDAHSDPQTVVTLLTDQNRAQTAPPEVRCAIAAVLASHVTGDSPEARNAVFERVYPLMELYIKDMNDDVRLRIANGVKELAARFTTQFLFTRMSSIYRRMLVDPQWRVKNVSVELLYAMILVGDDESFDNHLFPLLLGFLRDPHYKVRHFAVSGLPILAKKFSDQWLTKTLFAKLGELANSSNYLEREIFIIAISTLAAYFPSKYIGNYVVQPMITLLKDSVNSVVLTALNVLAGHLQLVHPFRLQCVLKPQVEYLIAHGPPTVRTAATEFLALIEPDR